MVHFFPFQMTPPPLKIRLKKDGDGAYKIVSPKPKRKLIEMKTWKNRGSADILHVMKKFCLELQACFWRALLRPISNGKLRVPILYEMIGCEDLISIRSQ